MPHILNNLFNLIKITSYTFSYYIYYWLNTVCSIYYDFIWIKYTYYADCRALSEQLPTTDWLKTETDWNTECLSGAGMKDGKWKRLKYINLYMDHALLKSFTIKFTN